MAMLICRGVVRYSIPPRCRLRLDSAAFSKHGTVVSLVLGSHSSHIACHPCTKHRLVKVVKERFALHKGILGFVTLRHAIHRFVNRAEWRVLARVSGHGCYRWIRPW